MVPPPRQQGLREIAGARHARRCRCRGQADPIPRICLLDVVPAAGFSDPRSDIVTGDISDPKANRRVLTRETHSVFRLAFIVRGQAKPEFDLGMRCKFDATRLILVQARKNGNRPRVVFVSSVADFGDEMVDALEPVAGADTVKRIKWQPGIRPSFASSTAGPAISIRYGQMRWVSSITGTLTR